MIQLVGPGGSGKSTAGALLAQRLDVAFVDLDEEFVANVGDISLYLDADGYDAYGRQNVDVYLALTAPGREAVLALSSGFMTYRPGIHPEYKAAAERSHLAPRHLSFFRHSISRRVSPRSFVASSFGRSPDQQRVRNK